MQQDFEVFGLNSKSGEGGQKLGSRKHIVRMLVTLDIQGAEF